MKKTLLQNNRSLLFVFIFIFFSQFTFAQLADFTLTLSKTDETCTGNGSLGFQVSGTTPGATIVYTVFLLPNTTTPIATLTANVFTGLAAGNYRVVATQTLGGLSNFQQQDIEILNQIVPLNYQLSSINLSCGLGQITVNVTQGIAVGYEIISGPVTFPLQSSNVFSMLPSGVYNIRVRNNCGDAVVQTYTLQNAGSNFTISNVSLPDCNLISCNSIKFQFQLVPVPNAVISYPVNVVYTITPPTGPNIVLNQTVNSAVDNIIFNEIPFYNAQTYSCSLTVTDNCGNVVSSNGNQVFVKLDLELSSDAMICAKNIKIKVCRFLPPYTVSFVSAPNGFNPLLFNPNHPGPFTSQEIFYTSTDQNQLPQGNYVIKITDACGRTVQNTVNIAESMEPGYLVSTVNCGSGQISMPKPAGTLVASVIMTAAPAGFDQTLLPYDVSFNIVNGVFLMQNLPAGSYTFTVLDVCGHTFTYTIEIPFVSSQEVISNILKGCDTGYASLKLNALTTTLNQVIITAAPPAYTGALDVSGNISDGIFYMNSLPEGVYSFHLEGECGLNREFSVFVPGYQVTQDNIVVDANCGSFNLFLQYQTNESYPHYYWLQKFNPATNQWMHPITGVEYTEGTVPTTANSYYLTNNSNNLNIASIGVFRILRVNSVFSNGDPALQACIKNIKDFEFTGGPKIITAYNLPCVNSSGNTVIVAEGTAPLSYSITTKDNQPFVVNNGTSNTFTGLEPGIYNFQVQDACGNIVNRLFDLTSLPLPSISQSGLCDGQNGELMVQNFPFLNYQWWKNSDPSQILSTTNILTFTPFSSATDSGTYSVRLYSSTPDMCTDQIVTYEIPATGNGAGAGQGTTSTACGNTTAIDLFTLLTGDYSMNGVWEEITNSGMLVGSNWLPVGIPYGTYQFKYTVEGLCGTSSEAIVTIDFGSMPDTPDAGVEEAIVCNMGTIHLTASTIVNATYEWNGPNGFSSNEQNPVINEATPSASGAYTVKAIISGCPSEAGSVTVTVNASPEFTIDRECNNKQFMVSVVPNGTAFPENVTYSWTGPDNYTSHENPINITGGVNGTYSVTVTFEDGCSNSASIDITTTRCEIQKGISPNNDNKNDFFDLTGFDVLNLKIFNRYGMVVFEQDGYTNQWHGQTSKGHDLPDTTYYYYIKFKSGEEKTGWVYVLHENK